MKNLIKAVFFVGALTLVNPVYSQEPIDCNKCLEEVRTQERTYSSLVKTIKYSQEYIGAKKKMGVEFDEGELSQINFMFSHLEYLEKKRLEKMRTWMKMNCPSP